jgi:glyoxylase-like metal-dependent hydrolase (beta-lactamase superfamily II)
VATTDRLELFTGAYDLAPGVRVIQVGGHTPGQSILEVTTPVGRAVLTSDAMHYYEQLARDRPFRQVTDVRGTFRAFERLREIVDGDEHLLVAGHDPDVFARFGQWTPDTADIAVQVGATA